MSPAGIVLMVIFIPLILFSIYSVITDKKKKREEAKQSSPELVYTHSESEDLPKSA